MHRRESHHWRRQRVHKPLFQRWREFEEAMDIVRQIAREKGLCNFRQWRKWTTECKLPDGIPRSPWAVYRQSGWDGVPDWLGVKRTRASKRKRPWMEFAQAKQVVQAEGLRSKKQWVEWARKNTEHPDIPRTPWAVYRRKGWGGMHDWLGAK